MIMQVMPDLAKVTMDLEGITKCCCRVQNFKVVIICIGKLSKRSDIISLISCLSE